MPVRLLIAMALLTAWCSAAWPQGPPGFLPPPAAADTLPPPTRLPADALESPAPAAPADNCPAPCPPPLIDKQHSGLKVHLIEEQTLEAVPNVALREVIVRIPTSDLQVEYREEKQRVTVMVLKPREEEQQITTTELVPETTVDCHGCPHVEYKPVPVCKIAKVTVFDQVPEVKEYTIKVPVVRPVEKEVQIRHFVLDTTPKPAVFRHYQLQVIPEEATYQVPTCAAPAATLPAEPAGPARPEPPAPLPAGLVPVSPSGR